MFKKQGRVSLMAVLFLIPGLRAEPVLSGDGASLSLKPCPSSPNCVSSLAEDAKHRVDPFPMSGTTTETLSLLAKAIETFPRATLRQQGGLYLKAEFRTSFGFVDDLEFLVDEVKGLVQVRSASRTGYWDLGVNRRRIEALRKVYLEMKDRK
jgi:uncharacterized protein (DUF1499 family)